MALKNLAPSVLRTNGLVGPFSVPAGTVVGQEYQIAVNNPTFLTDATLQGIEVALVIAWSFASGDGFPVSTAMSVEGGNGGKSPTVGVGVPPGPSGQAPIQYQVSYAARQVASPLSLAAVQFGLSEQWL